MKKTILVFTVLIIGFCVKAQENDQQEKEKAAINTTWEANKFRDNWFISVGGGIADLMSEESNYVKFGDRIKPTLSFSVGKWMSPVWGLRMNFTGAELQGFATWQNDLGLGSWYIGKNHAYPGQSMTNTYLPAHIDLDRAQFIKDRFLDNGLRSTSKGDGFDYSLKYVGASFDFMWNITNSFRPYKEDHFFDLVATGGIAYTHTFKEGSGVYDDGAEYQRTAVNSTGIKFGLQPTFRLSSAFDLFLEGQLYILPENFDRRVGDGNTMEGVANLLIGVTYNFAKRDFNKPEPVYIDNRPIEPVIVPVKDDCCDELRAQLQRIEGLLSQRPAEQPQKIEEVEKEKLKVIIQFVIDRHEVRESEMYKLSEIAAFMTKYPQVKVSVSGYADAKTAYPEYNMKLSERRSNEVIRILTTKYNIAKDRFSVASYGDTVQPFEINELNRAVIAFDIE